MGEPIEERMMAEWAARLEPGTYVTHLRLGRVMTPRLGRELTPQEAALLRITLPEADLVRRLPDGGVELVEFIVWRPQETLGQLLYYGGLIRSTPGYETVDPSRIRLRIVTGLQDPRFQEFVEAMGIIYEVFMPAWLEQALAARRGA